MVPGLISLGMSVPSPCALDTASVVPRTLSETGVAAQIHRQADRGRHRVGPEDDGAHDEADDEDRDARAPPPRRDGGAPWAVRGRSGQTGEPDGDLAGGR